MEPIRRVEVLTYRIPTEEPEADGTFSWDSTTCVVVRVEAGGRRGLGYTYGSSACAVVVDELLRPVVVGADALDVDAAWSAMVRAIRNQGRPGIASMSIAAVDCALWDLKARLLDRPLTGLLGAVRDDVPVYGSGGFTSYSDERLVSQLERWVGDRIDLVKIKIGESWGTKEHRDLERTALARRTIGAATKLFVDANGAYERNQAIRVGQRLVELGVSWFEEPVSSDDLVGLRAVRAALGLDVAAGEYGYDLPYFERLLRAEAVDVIQIDASRCAGISGFLRIARYAEQSGFEVSGHTAPSLHLHAACAVPNLRHLEYFHDHARVERLLFDGVRDPKGGSLAPDRSSPGCGLALKEADAASYRVA